MTSQADFEAAFSKAAGGAVIVESRSGKRYRVHPDQLPLIQNGGLIYGDPLARHPRARGVCGAVVWLRPENVKIVDAEGRP